ncbi:MAG: UDP-3-O-(3-hydroxymyristoyl)glucosamine N-acyltransferase [Planctomycetota bacterium]|nr:UDP-3-O-(3-hydroxymyristoyl)glucosamine N-acyltransferase [Planctomycetota bacterium]
MISRTLAELATSCGAVVDGDPNLRVHGPATLADAAPGQISFLANPRYTPQLATTRASAVVVTRDCVSSRPDLALLRCDDPSRAFTAVVQSFAPPEPVPPAGVHPSAVVDPTAVVDPSASIGPNCTIGREARIGARAVLVANVYVGAHAAIGPDTVLHPAVVVYGRVTIGARGLIHGGTVLGSDGFGFEPTKTGWAKIPQVGSVEVGDDVEMGANCAVDRGRFGPTHIGNGVKLDNLVHVAHNVYVDDGALLIAQVGIAGSTRIGKRAILAGQAGIAGHANIGDGARIGAQSGVAGIVPAGEDYFGSPARPRSEAIRSSMIVAKLPELKARIHDMSKRIAALEAAAAPSAEGRSNQESP